MRTIFIGLFVVLWLSLGMASAAAQPLEDGLAAYNARDYATAMRLLEAPAEQGNSDAQYALGIMLQFGFAGQHDPSEAMRWYWMAAAQGRTDALYMLAFMYKDGSGVLQDYVQAAKLFRLIAEGTVTGRFRPRALVGSFLGLCARG
jgi:TPR repeat protein